MLEPIHVCKITFVTWWDRCDFPTVPKVVRESRDEWEREPQERTHKRKGGDGWEVGIDTMGKGCREGFRFSSKNDISAIFRRNTAEVFRSSVGRGEGAGSGVVVLGVREFRMREREREGFEHGLSWTVTDGREGR